jgi:very-short-patch-repair endonuclease
VRHRPLLALATKQHGVVSTRQLAALGYTRSSASKAHGVGRLVRLHRGVYAVGHVRLTWHSSCLAGVLACRPAVASHWSAAWLWGLIGSAPSAIHLTVPSKRRSKPEFRVHSARLADADVEEAEGIPVTSLPRTLLDLAALVPKRRLERLLDRAEKLKFFDLRAFESLLGRTTGHPGHARLRQALRIYRPELAVLRSDLERDFRALLRAANLRLPSPNVNVGPYELDCYWEPERFCVELDTYATHGSPLSFEQDRIRERELRKLGIEVERVTDVQLQREPDAVIAAVALNLERRRRYVS